MYDPKSKFEKHVLPSGVEVWAACLSDRPDIQRQALSIAIHSGSFHGGRGLAHFTEHGVATTGKFDKVIEEINLEGGGVNCGRTSVWQTTYGFLTPLDRFNEFVERFCGYVLKSDLSFDVEAEKKIILSELYRKFETVSSANHQIFYYQCLLKDHWTPAYSRGLGTPEFINAVTPDKVLEFYAKHYTPANISLITAGPMTIAEVVGVLGQSGWGREPQRGQRATEPKLDRELKESPVKACAFEEPIDASKFFSGVAVSPLATKQAVRLASDILEGIFFKRLRMEKNLIYGVGCNWSNYREFYELSVGFNGVNADRIQEAHDEYQRVWSEIGEGKLLTEEQLAQVKKGFVNAARYNDWTLSNIVDFAESDIVFNGRVEPDSEYLQKMDAATLDEVRQVAINLHPEKCFNRWMLAKGAKPPTTVPIFDLNAASKALNEGRIPQPKQNGLSIDFEI